MKVHPLYESVGRDDRLGIGDQNSRVVAYAQTHSTPGPTIAYKSFDRRDDFELTYTASRSHDG